MLVGFRETQNTVAVIFGGRSSEHEVSLRSALFILKQMPAKYHIIPVGIDRNGDMWSLDGIFTAKDFEAATDHDLAAIVAGTKPLHLPNTEPVRSVILPYRKSVLSSFPESPLRILNLEAGIFFPVLHGPNGEDGRVQGMLEFAELPYVGCDQRASVIGIDKNLQKIIARDVGVNIARYELVELEEWVTEEKASVARVEKNIGFPCFVKPNSLGSAVGVTRANSRNELIESMRNAFKFDRKILIEERIVGTEVECAFLGTPINPRITVAGEIAPEDFYSYDAKYLDANAAKLFIPARLETPRMQELRAMAAKLAKAFGLEGLCRIDFWNCQKSEKFIFNEINTIPGMTSISMFPKLWQHEGTLAAAWIEEVIEHGRHRAEILAKLSVNVHETDS